MKFKPSANEFPISETNDFIFTESFYPANLIKPKTAGENKISAFRERKTFVFLTRQFQNEKSRAEK